jgi:hypothetical protein
VSRGTGGRLVVRSLPHLAPGQALVELVVALPVLLVVAVGGTALARLAVQQTDLRLAARVAASSRDPRAAAKEYLKANGVVDVDRVTVRVTTWGNLRRVTVTCAAAPGWWPNAGGSGDQGGYLSASAGRARAVLCIRSGR